MMDAIYALISWIGDSLKQVWQAFVDFLGDFFVDISDMVLQGIASIVVSIPAPSFLEGHSLSSIIHLLPSEVLYFVGMLHLEEGFALLAAAVAFRMARKVVTLFQW